jgi:hypothetical protein
MTNYTQIQTYPSLLPVDKYATETSRAVSARATVSTGREKSRRRWRPRGHHWTTPRVPVEAAPASVRHLGAGAATIWEAPSSIWFPPALPVWSRRLSGTGVLRNLGAAAATGAISEPLPPLEPSQRRRPVSCAIWERPPPLEPSQSCFPVFFRICETLCPAPSAPQSTSWLQERLYQDPSSTMHGFRYKPECSSDFVWICRWFSVVGLS